jgi:hypothetical protein
VSPSLALKLRRRVALKHGAEQAEIVDEVETWVIVLLA